MIIHHLLFIVQNSIDSSNVIDLSQFFDTSPLVEEDSLHYFDAGSYLSDTVDVDHWYHDTSPSKLQPVTSRGVLLFWLYGYGSDGFGVGRCLHGPLPIHLFFSYVYTFFW